MERYEYWISIEDKTWGATIRIPDKNTEPDKPLLISIGRLEDLPSDVEIHDGRKTIEEARTHLQHLGFEFLDEQPPHSPSLN